MGEHRAWAARAYRMVVRVARSIDWAKLARWPLKRARDELGPPTVRPPVAGALGWAGAGSRAVVPRGPYLESGLITLPDQPCTSGPLSFSDALRAWVASRAGAFSMIGELAIADPGQLAYPPLAPFPGSVNQGEGPSILTLCTDTNNQDPNAVAGRPSSMWSGSLMPLFIQAKYGSEHLIGPGSNAFSVVIDGHEYANTPQRSHWIIEEREAGALTWWLMEAIPGQALRAGQMLPDPTGAALRDYILAHGISAEPDLTWLRAWIFRGLAHPQAWEDASGDPVPAITPLGYGWHVSDSGLLAGAHSYELANDGTNSWSEWTRHTLSIAHGPRGWSVTAAGEATGRLETQRNNLLPIWGLTDQGIPERFLTDSRAGLLPAKASNAEIYGWYEGESWEGFRAKDSGGENVLHCQTNGPLPACEDDRWTYYGDGPGEGAQTCVMTREIECCGNGGINGAGVDRHSFNWSFIGDTFDYPQWQPIYQLQQPCPYDDPQPDCGEHNMTARVWSGTYDTSRQAHTEVTNVTEAARAGLALAHGVCDGLITLAGNTVTSNLKQDAAESERSLVTADIYQGCANNTYIFVATVKGPPQSPWPYSQNPSTEAGNATRSDIEVELRAKHAPGLGLHQDSGGVSAVSNNPSIADLQGSGLIDLAGWGAYFDWQPGDEPPGAIYAKASAVERILSSCKAPGCQEIAASDTSAADPIPLRATWVGSV